MTAPKPEAPTLDEQIMCGHCRMPMHKDDARDYYGKYVAHRKHRCIELLTADRDELRERLRAIENAKGMPPNPGVCLFPAGLADYWTADRIQILIDSIAVHRLHAHHLQDRLNRMEALLREPPLEECYRAGKGPSQVPGEYHEGGLPDTADERARFEEYMRGHCWEFGGYDQTKRCYDTVFVRMLYGVWRDRGAMSAALLAKVDRRR